MRINQFVARSTGFSRRHADKLILSGQVTINNSTARLGENISSGDDVRLSGERLQIKKLNLIMLNKPEGFVCSRRSQGSKTIYELLPKSMAGLFSIGRLDKGSSGLLLLTNDGELAQSLTHPKFQKIKTYQVVLDKPLKDDDILKLTAGVELEDGTSSFLSAAYEGTSVKVELAEGRNRQIRRTFGALGYRVKSLHRTTFGPYRLEDLAQGRYKRLG